MIEAVIFDMDGLLIDSEPVWDRARRMMAAANGVDWNQDDHRAVMGVSTVTWVDYMIRRLNLRLAPDQVEARIVSQMVALYEKEIPFFQGAVEAVALAAAHYPTGLASGSPRRLIDTVTGHAAMYGRFDVIFSSDAVDRGKPHPDVYLAVAEGLGVAAANCLCLEDSANGILAGKNAGMRVIAVPDVRFPPATEVLQQADWVLESLQAFNAAFIAQLKDSKS